MATKSKKTNTNKRSSSGSKTSSARTAKRGGTGIAGEVTVFLVLAFCLLLFLANFKLVGSVGDVMRSVMLGLFGSLGYLFPAAVFLLFCFLLSNRNNIKAVFRAILAVLFFLLLCGFLHLISGEFDNYADFSDYYRMALTRGLHGGAVGGFFGILLIPTFGTVGSYVITLILLIVLFVGFTGISLLQPLKRRSASLATSARESASRHKETAARRREERREDARIRRAEQHEDAEKMRQLRREETYLMRQERRAQRDKDMEETLATYTNGAGTASGVTFVDLELPDSSSGSDEVPFVMDEPAPAPVPEPQPEPEYEPEAEPEMPASVEEPVRSVRRAPAKTKEKTAEAEEVLEIPAQAPAPDYKFPPLNLLAAGKVTGSRNYGGEQKSTAAKLEETMRDFGVNVHVADITRGPSVTRYELTLDHGVKVSRVLALTDDIKLSLAVPDIRIEAPIPGKSAIGIEVPNTENSMVYLRDLLNTPEYIKHPSKLAVCVGRDIGGNTIVANLEKMPHLLIAGTTGSGKSVLINSMLLSILYKARPEEVRLILIDPKVVELSVFNGIPHLLTDVVTDPKKATGALNWAVAEMERRYRLFADTNVRNLSGYNDYVRYDREEDPESELTPLPQILVIVDEMSDLMQVAAAEVEESITRLAAMARAAGIHLVLATQRPSVNVITGVIKANIPSRIALKTFSSVDSRTILDMKGAEKLLGNGDMLFYPSGYQKPVRVQSAFVSDQEVAKVVQYISRQYKGTQFEASLQERLADGAPGEDTTQPFEERDEYFEQAGRFIIEKDKASIGMLQRMYRIGFNRAARIMEQLSAAGVVGPEEGTKPRKILMNREQFDAYIRGESIDETEYDSEEDPV